MPTVKKVILSETQKCTKCKGDMEAGLVVVKDRRNKRAGTTYYHTACPAK